MSEVSCCLGLSGPGRIVVGEAGIPFLEERPERAIERPCSGLQQQVRAALCPSMAYSVHKEQLAKSR
jgi:hypothetical protein